MYAITTEGGMECIDIHHRKQPIVDNEQEGSELHMNHVGRITEGNRNHRED
jgi:hypothetical protein